MVEAVALRAIGGLDRAEEDVTANLMSSLLESLEGEPLTEPLVTSSTTAVGAKITVTMLTFVAAANTGQNVMDIQTVVDDGSYAPTVSVPLAVLDQISGGSSGPVAITTGKIPMQFARDIEAVGAAKAKMDLNVSDAEPAPALATQPFSITVYDSNGEPIRGIQLAQPMTLQLAEDANDSISCAFFNQTSFRWSTSGLRRVRPASGNNTAPGAPVPLVCETDHLSIFSGVVAIPAADMEGYEEIPFESSNVANGGISPGTGGSGVGADQRPDPGGGVDQVVDVVGGVLKCTRAAGIFSAEGMDAVGRGEWTGSSSATALFVSLALFAVAAFAAFAKDISRNQTKWMGQLMSLTYPDDEQDEDEEEEKEERAKILCKYCILVLQGLQAGVDADSLELAILVRTAGSKEGNELAKGKSPLYAAAVKLADITNVSAGYARATNLFLEANWLARMLLLFPAVHRSLSAGHGSLIYSRVSNVVVIFMKIFFSGALAALFFQSGASGPDSEAACIPGAGLGVTLLLGLASALVSDFMIYGLWALRKQNFKAAHGNVALQLKVKEWRVRNLLFWAISLLTLIVSLYVIMAFFATVTAADTETWAAGALVVLLEEFFFGPLLVAGAYSLLVTHTIEGDVQIATSMRMAAGAVQAPFRAWDGPSASDFRIPVQADTPAQGGQLRALGAAPHEDLGVQSLTLGEDQHPHHGGELVLQSQQMDEQRKLQEQLREQLEMQKRQLEQQQQMQAELRQQLQRQQQEMEDERRRRHRSPPPERPPVRYQQQAWQQDNRTQVQQAPTALPLPGAVHLNAPALPQMVTRPTQQVSSVNLGLQRAVRHGAVVRSGRPGPPSWPPPALRDAGRFGGGVPPQPDPRRYSRQ